MYFPPIDPNPWWQYLLDILLYLSPFAGILLAFWLQRNNEKKKDRKLALARYIGEITKKRLIINQVIAIQTWLKYEILLIAIYASENDQINLELVRATHGNFVQEKNKYGLNLTEVNASLIEAGIGLIQHFDNLPDNFNDEFGWLSNYEYHDVEEEDEDPFATYTNQQLKGSSEMVTVIHMERTRGFTEKYAAHFDIILDYFIENYPDLIGERR